MLDQGLTSCKNPSVHNVFRLLGVMIVHKALVVGSFVQFGLSQEESERVDPFADNSVSDFSNSVVSESQVITSHNWRIHQIQTVEK